MKIPKNGKTYRIRYPMCLEIIEIAKAYMIKNDCIISDAKIANAIVKKGIATIEEKDIKEYIENEDNT